MRRKHPCQSARTVMNSRTPRWDFRSLTPSALSPERGLDRLSAILIVPPPPLIRYGLRPSLWVSPRRSPGGLSHSGIKFLKISRRRVLSNPPFPKDAKGRAAFIVGKG